MSQYGWKIIHGQFSHVPRLIAHPENRLIRRPGGDEFESRFAQLGEAHVPPRRGPGHILEVYHTPVEQVRLVSVFPLLSV